LHCGHTVPFENLISMRPVYSLDDVMDLLELSGCPHAADFRRRV
jgi:hypothetical protein